MWLCLSIFNQFQLWCSYKCCPKSSMFSALGLTVGARSIHGRKSKWAYIWNGGCKDGSAQLHIQTIWTDSEAMKHTNGKLRRRISSSFFLPLLSRVSTCTSFLHSTLWVYSLFAVHAFTFSVSFEFRTQSVRIKIKWVCVWVKCVCKAFFVYGIWRVTLCVWMRWRHIYILSYAIK